MTSLYKLEIPASEDNYLLSAQVQQEFKEKVNQLEKDNEKLNAARGDLTALDNSNQSLSGINGQNPKKGDLNDVLSSGITKEKAMAMFDTDMAKTQQELKQLLASCGVNKITQNVFDGLSSFHHQTGSAAYVYTNGEKISLTGLYQKKDWMRIASFIASDDRDKSMRFKEAAMIVGNDYGPNVNIDRIVNIGILNTAELINKGKLNAQTGDPATDLQTASFITAYWNAANQTAPGIDHSLQTRIINDNFPAAVAKRPAGPWPY